MSQRPEPVRETLVQEAHSTAPLNTLTALGDVVSVLVPGTGLSLHSLVQTRMLEVDPASVQPAPQGTPVQSLTVVLDFGPGPAPHPIDIWPNRIELLAQNAVRTAAELGVRTATVHRSALARLPQQRTRVAVELSVW